MNRVVCVLAALCLSHVAHAAERSKAPRTALPPRATAQSYVAWRNYLASAPPPRVGCFTTSYPSTRWRQVRCRRGPLIPDVVGNSTDYVATDTPVVLRDPAGNPIPVLHPIRFAEGTFPTVTGVQSVVDSKTGLTGDYSLQLNSNRFDTPACAAASQPGCKGWEQFVYAVHNGMVDKGTGTSGQLYIQYWLVNWGSTPCPGSFVHPDNAPNDCVQNGPSQELPDGFPINQLANFLLIAGSGQRDTLIFINSTYNFVYAIANDPNILGLGPRWIKAEFNVFGLGNKSQANFNDGSSIVVSLSIDHGAMIAPLCEETSFTGETNNLNLTATPSSQAGPLPRIVFTETSAVHGPTSCSASNGNGDGLHVVYRWVHPSAGAHFYTQDPSGELAPETGYTYEGAPFSLFSQFDPGTTEFFRFRCPNGHHYYTTDSNGELGAGICQREQSLGFIATSQLPGTTQLFRWYNPDIDDHFYTTDPTGELAPTSGYHQEQSPGFVKPGPGF